MRKLLFMALLIIQATHASAAPPTSRVINGTASPTGKWKWMASISELGSDPRQGHFCGGVLIDSTHVLTAAHCVINFIDAPESLQVTLGRTRLSDDAGVTVPSAGLVVHPDYSPEQSSNDIAIIRIEESGVTEAIEPVSFADPASWDADSPASVIGWGYVDENYPVRPDNLQEAEIPIVADNDCSDRIGIDFDSSSMLCAGTLATSSTSDDGVDSCNGDSGGPLVVQTDQGYKLAGIVSWGYACGSEKYWGVYTKVAKFHDWIVSRPPVAPYARVLPAVRGRPEIENTLVCQKGSWGGEGSLSYRYQWSDTQEGLLKESNSPSYKLKRNDIGRNLRCSVVASNESSETVADSPETGFIFPVTRKVTLRGTPRRAPARAGMTCDKSTCSVLLSFRNSKVKNVHIITGLTATGSASGAKSVRGRQLTQDSWLVRLSRSSITAGGVYIRLVYYGKPGQLIEFS